ncbi:uncharacterized protein LOC133310712 [Gastrolobium bilobum]|uniref:uncharacterized protein LOC133310712 n=1 Tax=Gastrolobium bilobum TaxID=150636 RepID=UPI002AB040C1|nr:uncharacterized protein LOC133310712 [Gastrolobium bilobum]
MSLLISLKVFFIFAGLVFIVLGLNVLVRLIKEFLVMHVPLTWNLCLSCFKPPYRFLLLNTIIIITVVASSMFHRSHSPPVYDPVPIEEGLEPSLDVHVTVNAVQEDGLLESPTMEEVWNEITKGQEMVMKKKSETFKERRKRIDPNHPMVCAASSRKETSLDQNELNQRAEAFIRKFNEDLKLQKERSLNRYMR